MNNEEIFADLETVIDVLEHVVIGVEHKGNKLVLKKALELIDSVAWQYEEEE